MNSFAEHIAGNGRRPGAQELGEVLKKYPWFLTARRMLAEETGQTDALLELHYLSHPKKVTPHATEPPQDHDDTPLSQTEEEIIDSFLRKEDLRVIPTEETPEYDAAHGSSVLELSDEMVSEELADIYRNQGLNEQARQIYERLILFYPEKSIYFAEIIGEMDSADSQKQ
jgi:hypothetical protein